MRVLLLAVFMFILTIPVPSNAQGEVFMCPMHPHITGEEGDSCPICGMTLVQKMTEDTKQDNPVLSIDPKFVHVLGIKTAEVEQQNFGQNIRAYGQIKPSTRLQHAVDVRAKGWIVDLQTNAVGDIVQKGDILFSYYSPELTEAQADFINGRRIGNAEQRLRLYGMDDKALALLKRKKTYLEATPFHAPISGVVTELNIREGSHLEEGSSALMIQDYSKVWVEVDVPIRDLDFIKIGSKVTLIQPENNSKHNSVVDYIHPQTDQQKRTARIRAIVNNIEGTLKTESYIDAVFNVDVQTRLAVPSEAILYDQANAYVLESLGEGEYRPVFIETGITANGHTEVLQGLSAGQNIVISGQFMLDAESKLQGLFTTMQGDTPHSQAGGHQHVH